MILSVHEYDKLESEAKKCLSNRFLEAFQPELIKNVGFPSNITNDDEIYRYVDSMHDGRLKYYYDLGMNPTEEEWLLIKQVCTSILYYTKEKFGKEVVVKAPCVSSANVIRMIGYLSELIGNQKPTVFEIGGGCGVMGTMLHNAGYKFISTDITQPFYLLQNQLWNYLFPSEVYEYISDDEIIDKEIPILHIPYWQLWNLRNSNLEADIIISNHAVGEMHERALRFYLRWGKVLLRNSKYRFFVCQHFGYNKKMSGSDIINLFHNYGYHLIYKKGIYYIFSLKIGVDEKKNEKGIEKLEQKMDEKTKVPLDSMISFFESLDGKYDTPDEEFIHYLGLDWI